jgi:type I restriction enzyme, S subunit
MVWEVKKLGDVCELINRGIPPKYTEKSGVQVINQKCIRDHQINLKLTRKHDNKVKQVNPQKYIQLGDVLVNSTGTGTLGRVAQVGNTPTEDITVDTHVTIVRPIKGLFVTDFFGYMLIFIEKQIKEGGEGASGQTELARNTLKEKFKITFPTELSKQKRIVTILDKSFENIIIAKENAEKNLRNAKEIFESYLQGVFENKGKGWEEKKLEELGDKKNAIISGPFGSNLKVKDYTCEGIPLIRLQNIGKGYFINKNIKYVSIEKAEQLKSHSFIPGDVVLAKLGIPIGKTCIIPKDFKAGIIVADIVRIRLNTKIVDYNFLEYYLNTNIAVSQLNKNVSGATRPRVNLSDVREIKIHLPPLTQQKQIVLQLDQLSSKTKSLEWIYQKKLQDLEELKKSILQKAFNGELTEC